MTINENNFLCSKALAENETGPSASLSAWLMAGKTSAALSQFTTVDVTLGRVTFLPRRWIFSVVR